MKEWSQSRVSNPEPPDYQLDLHQTEQRGTAPLILGKSHVQYLFQSAHILKDQRTLL